MIIYGSRLFGSVDQVKGAFSVRTKFGHVNFLPLIPLESWLVLEGSTGTKWRGFKLESMSMRSVLMAWLRVALFLGGLGVLFAGLVTMSSAPATTWMALQTLGVGLLVGLWYSFRATRATYERAMELARTHQLGPGMEATIEASFGRAAAPAVF